MGEITHKLTHVEEARARLLSQYAGRLDRDLDPVSAQVQEVEDALWAVWSGRGVGTATGHTLDLLGRIVGEDRQGELDALYRVRIRARIQANLSDGTWDDIHRVAAILLDTQWPLATVSGAEIYPAAFEYRVDGLVLSADQIKILTSFLRSIRGAGIELRFGWSAGPLVDAFAFAFGSTLSAPVLVGATTLDVVTIGPFSGTGSVVVGVGADQETVTYTGIAGNQLTGVSATTKPHGINDPVSLVSPATGKGYGDTANPATGGKYVSIIIV